MVGIFIYFFLGEMRKKWLYTRGRINLPSGDTRKRVIFKQLLRDFSTAWVVGPLRPVIACNIRFTNKTENVFPFSYCACHQNNYRSHRSVMPVRLGDEVFKCFFFFFAFLLLRLLFSFFLWGWYIRNICLLDSFSCILFYDMTTVLSFILSFLLSFFFLI